MHIHVISENGEAKFWLEPTVEVATQYGLKFHEIKELKKVTEENLDEIKESWRKHFRCGSN